ncbi:MAG: DUF814 domain-containing protein [Candidatus Micrarchaeota archaeon]|nr:DUF814 domain-containing protein [Candidatus Micrarchaeota archaeon]MDE1847694.1 DUF814 domain-containing protein [Candidatus Micrarchaeota archaeon]MDE1864123.1 DUF814 domain-containing protein [Candidatus Micrarchaeota archaeon]
METQIDLTKSAQDNANDYFIRSKRAKKKLEGAQQSVLDLEKKLERARSRLERSSFKKKIKIITKQEWYEKFNWFFTSSGMLTIGGRDAVQNEAINSKHFENADLFFHADIFGASLVVLKDGRDTDDGTKLEAAQFAACHSSAWKQGLSTVNVYALRREQVSKSSNKGSLGTGSFAMSGEREWFRGVKLELAAFLDEGKRLNIVPAIALERLGQKGVRILIGETKKSDAAKTIAKRLGYDDIDYVMQQLPAGEFSIG